MSQRRGLGRGLGALIPSGPADAGPMAPDGETGRDPGSAEQTVGTEPQRPRDNGTETPATTEDDAAEPPATPDSDQNGADQNGADQNREPRSGEGLRTVAGARFAELPIQQIVPNPRQPREVFDEDEMAELVHSIREIGLLQPVVVRQTGPGAYELIMGERRWRATEQAGQANIPAIVRDASDEDMLRDALLENLHRSALNPLEEAAAYQQLLDDFGCTHDELATRIGRSRPQISNTLRLLRLTPAVQRRVAAGVLSAGHARTLVGVEDAAEQDRLAGRVVAEGLSVRALEELASVGGSEQTTTTRKRTHHATAPRLADLADRLSERYDTRVKVDLGRSKGKITVEFASLEDLERIVELMDPQTHKPL